MERKQLEVYSEASNYGIVRMPGRSYPGCVIQGDSLRIVLHEIRGIARLAQGHDNIELQECIADLEASIADRLSHYQAVLREHGIDIP
ncbi:hypothetical protein NA78x_002506 [Anatilimnocola sp. NA78]|uniref:DUF6959 family protein n=1 Tax=Anatilimnocola sp. NA78 TaxID=3415683 RepID=UPI003CE5769D